MAEITRRIGLSLGADICWPIAYTEILERLGLRIPHGGDTVRFEVERVRIEPFDLQRQPRYDLVIDRLTHWYYPTREWIKKSVTLDDVYVFNNPWSVQSMEKQTTYCAMMGLGLPVPRTWLLPPKEYAPTPDLDVTLERYADMFDLGEIGAMLGYPLYMKPYDGGAWRGVSRIENEEQLRRAYDESGRFMMHLQASVEPYDRFVRCIGLGPQTRLVRYDPQAPLHDRYTLDEGFVEPSEEELLRNMTLTINGFFGWDFNSCEALRSQGAWIPIDFANACPDSQVTSLHYHFPWLIGANLRWSIFAATVNRSVPSLDWAAYYAAVEEGMTLAERVQAGARVTLDRLDADRFEEFCDVHLADLDEACWEFFGTDVARDAVRRKVEALYPAHEVEQFTELFWGRIQQWREAGARDGQATT